MTPFPAIAYSVLVLCSQQTPSKERIPLPRPRPPIEVVEPTWTVDSLPVYRHIVPAPPIPKRQDRLE